MESNHLRDILTGALKASRRDLAPREVVVLLLLYATLHALISALGAVFLQVDGVPLLWPSAGLLFTALYLVKRRHIAGIVTAATIAEFAVTAGFGVSAAPPMTATLSMLIGAVTSALIVRRLVVVPIAPDIPTNLRWLLGALVGAGISAMVYAASMRTVGGGELWLLSPQLVLAGVFLGLVIATPPCIIVIVGLDRSGIKATAGTVEHIAILAGVGLAALAARTSSGVLAATGPIVMLLPLLWAAVRTRPSYVMVACGLLAGILAALLRSAHPPLPWMADNGAVALLASQLILVVCALSGFMLAIVLAARSRMAAHVDESERRYREFIENLAEAVWRVALTEPMPLALSPSRQQHWIKRHAWLAECNRRYRDIPGHVAAGSILGRPWCEQSILADVFLLNLPRIIAKGYELRDVELEIANPDGSTGIWRTSMQASINDDKLVGIWGVAHDISELASVRARSQHSEQRIRELSNLLENAEDIARKDLAADLHDGPAQDMVGLELLLAALAVHVRPDGQQLFRDIRDSVAHAIAGVRDVLNQATTPQLRDGEFALAIRKLLDGFREHDQLRAELALVGHFDRLPERYLFVLYRTLRELLRNVARHSGAKRCWVRMLETAGGVQLEVRDQGCGFDLQSVLKREIRGGGFGLCSIMDRVQDIGGSIEIVTAPGEGAQVTVLLPGALDKAGGAGMPVDRAA
ncbi:MAG: MASE1 domain-containing protein [Gammaproteobacteria bacterium]|nr:MASE1 domain-containing protein [Gammaproteobacteria bacterium]